MTQLRITEIFHSLQGEGLNVGVPTVFVRLTGCPLRCVYCDTAYAFKGGEKMSLDKVIAQVDAFGTPDVMVTGGEPLAQEACLELLSALSGAGFRVSLETSGALDIGGVDSRVVTVMDLKAPGSGEESKNRLQNLQHLKRQDQLKMVIRDRSDYDWACEQLREHRLAELCTVLFSPVKGEMEAAELADWILADRLPVRFQIQLHKYLWGDVAGK